MIVSRVMGDNPLQTFTITILRPLLGTLAASFVQCFFLSFTDFGIPASVGGEYQVIASVLYNEMLGSIPNFNNGSVIAMIMLIPSILSISILRYLEKYNIRYTKRAEIDINKNKFRDISCFIFTLFVSLSILSVFSVIFIVPFVKGWPYDMSFTLDCVIYVFKDNNLSEVLKNSIIVSLITAVLGSILAYGSALVVERSSLSKRLKNIIEGIVLVTNTIPGMVLGLAFLFIFTGTPLQNTLMIIILCNVVHFFSTPYLMMKNSLQKMNSSWETTAMLMGDSWLKTIYRIVTPNAFPTIIEVFSYYFTNAMVTVSAVVFIASARTMVITTKIKELQHFAKFNEIFILSICILLINFAVKGGVYLLTKYGTKRSEAKVEKKVLKMDLKKLVPCCIILTVAFCSIIGIAEGSSKNNDEVIIYSNADDEAIEAMEKTLDENGYKGKYIIQTFGTSELGGKLLAEGKNIEADVVTMSSFYLESAQKQNDMFLDLTFDRKLLKEVPDFYSPITCQEGSLIINTTLIEEKNLPIPKSIKDLADPIYKDNISVADIKSSSTSWLLVQALINEYGEDGAKDILTKLYENAGPHIESSGSGPIKKVRSGEVAIGFGLRHQAISDKQDGLPIDFVDPIEGNFSLTESIAVIDKGDKTNSLSMEISECIIKKGRTLLQDIYPNPIYEGEVSGEDNVSENPKTFSENLTAELLERHIELSESCK